MASSLLTGPYTAQHTSHYSYVQAPQPPPSPPMDDNSKCSLPSISNLLGLADQGSPTSETSPQNREPQQQATSKPDTRPNSSHYATSNPSTFGMRGAGALPPTPPMSSDASFDGYNSPSTRSVSQIPVISQAQAHPHGYYYETTPPLEADTRPMTRVPVHQASYSQPSFHGPSSYMQPTAMAPYYPPMQPTPPPQPQISGLYYQRPLPQQFPPLSVPMQGPNPWQHHHYIAPSAASAFPQSQDRYICQTCNKAFSRPSSLRIHSHSHTGEKPFKCPHVGCGKAFSVRSNMKRHERGCHSFDGSNHSSNSSPLLS